MALPKCLFGRNDLPNYVRETCGVERQSDPEETNLIFGNDTHERSCPDDWKNISEVQQASIAAPDVVPDVVMAQWTR